MIVRMRLQLLVSSMFLLGFTNVLAKSDDVSTKASDPGTAALYSEIRRVSETTQGIVGVAAWRFDGKGERLLVNGDMPFPMASTFKIAIAGAVLAKVERRELTLGQMIPITPDQMIVSDVMADRFIHPGLSVSIHNLLELMMTASDNTATDVLMTAAGGAAAVNKWVKDQGVQGLRVDHGTDGIIRRFYKLSREGSFPDALAAALKKDPQLTDRSHTPDPAFDEDPQDTATPRAMGELIERVFNGKALNAESTQLLVGIMERCRTGEQRIPGRMPAGTTVAHKTGTIGGTVNDVGVVYLPDGGKVMVSVFIKKGAAPYEQRERAIAEIARSIRDYYLFGR